MRCSASRKGVHARLRGLWRSGAPLLRDRREGGSARCEADGDSLAVDLQKQLDQRTRELAEELQQTATLSGPWRLLELAWLLTVRGTGAAKRFIADMELLGFRSQMRVRPRAETRSYA